MTQGARETAAPTLPSPAGILLELALPAIVAVID